MSRARWVPVVCVVLSAACTASTDTGAARDLEPEDFAYGLSLSVPADQPFARFDVPAEVMSATAWPDLRDIRVFNASRETVPFAVIQSPGGADTQRRVALQSFRLESPRAGQVPRIDLDARERGVALRVVPGTTTESGTEYLLALSDPDLNAPIEKLHFEWRPHTTNWQQKVTVLVSSDLDGWRPAAIARPLMDLRTADGQQLRHAEIVVDRVTPQSSRYWKLHFEPGFAPALTSVEGEVTTVGIEAPGVRIATTSSQERDGGAVYELTARQPVARVRITPQDANSVLLIAIEGQDVQDKEWQEIARTVAYRLNHRNGGEQFSDPVSLGGRMVQRLRLRPLSASWGSSLPAIEVERDPVTIILNARGAGPFLLAWGSRAATSTAIPVRTLIPDSPELDRRSFEYARETGRVELGGPSRLTELAPTERGARWRTTMIWVLLVAGAGGLALLAFVVYREVRQTA